jgi:hypothetical protein
VRATKNREPLHNITTKHVLSSNSPSINPDVHLIFGNLQDLLRIISMPYNGEYSQCIGISVAASPALNGDDHVTGTQDLELHSLPTGQPRSGGGEQHHRPVETGINVFLPECSITRASFSIQERIDATIQMATAARAVTSGDRENGHVRSVFRHQTSSVSTTPISPRKGETRT